MSNERARWRIAGLAVLGLAVVALVIGINPANLPEPWLDRWLQQKLPDGSSIVVVRHAIEDEGWQTVDEWVADTGSLVLVHLGDGWLPRRYVYVYFAFDRYGRLVSVDVQKDVSERARSR
jgi:hypothetical protein